MILALSTVSIIFIIITICSFVAIIFCNKKTTRKIIGILWVLFLVMFFMIFAVTCGSPVSSESVVITNYDIRAISSSDSLSIDSTMIGSAYGGSYTSLDIDGCTLFNCYVKETDGRYHLLKIPAEKTTIITTDGESKLELVNVIIKYEWLIFGTYGLEGIEYKLYIPENGLTTDIYL